MLSFPPPQAKNISLDLAGVVLTWRRLTWREEIAFALTSGGHSRMDYVAGAMWTMNGKTITQEQAKKFLDGLPRPIRERILIFYYGSLPARRLLKVDYPYTAPEAAKYQSRVDVEAEQQMSAEEEQLRRTFGDDEVDSQMALAKEMARGTNYAGVSKALEEAPLDAETQVYQSGRQPQSQSQGDHLQIDEEVPRYRMDV